jgi:hypothetical protein
MRFIRLQSAVLALSLLMMAGVIANFSAPMAVAQSTVSGEITGAVTDITGAVVPKATVTLTSADLGVKSVTITSSTGTYRFALLQPATYKVSVSAGGFGTASREVVVSLGQITPANIQLGVAGKTETISVEADSELIHSESANLAETVDAMQVELLPNSGNDMTNFALTTPGVALSTGGGYGNFTSNGIGGMSNLYTVNGNDYNDPYLNLNNSGSSNMLLGSNEVQEATVVTNGYTAQYGRAAGTNMNFTTKSGTNKFHGDLIWNWNGTALNANDWFNKPNDFNGNASTARPHAVSNQWAGDVGGPILKNKLFFYYDNEGIRYVLPSGGPVDIPSPAFQTAMLANLNTVSPASVPFFTKAFAVYNGASGYSAAVPVTTGIDPNLGCGDINNDDTIPNSGLPISTNIAAIPLGTACALQFQSNVNNLNTERLQTIRVDVNPNSKDKLNFRYKGDRGVQATSTDPINSNFSANSVQPSNEAQASWTRILNNNMVNQFIASDIHYVAKFGPPNFAAAVAVFPTSLAFTDGLYSPLGNFSTYPSGRVVEQYQFVDDFTWTKGSHGIKAGVNYRREDISDYSGSSGLTGLTTNKSMTSFYSGIIGAKSTFAQTFSKAPEVPVASFSLGLYIQDEWRVNSKLKVTLALRVDSNSNEVCQKNCYSRPASSFASMGHSATTPYNTTVLAVKQAFPGLEPAVWGPRAGFDWTPLGEKTVIRGGIGLFGDLYPGLLGSRAITNLPNVASFTISSSNGSAANSPISPAASGSVFTQASASNTALQNGFSSGATLSTIQAAVAAAGSHFSAPSLTTFATHVVNPKYLKWNLEIEHSFSAKTAVSVNYAGNHGYDLFITNRSLNSYCTVANCAAGFEDLPAAAPDTRFGNIREYDNGGIANYAGLTASIKQRVTKGFTGTLNYTWSHTLDELYEGGIEPLNALDNPSIVVAIDPVNVRKYNYASADQDIRSLLTANFYWQLPFKTRDANLNEVFGGWVLSGTIQRTSGTPMSAYNPGIVSGTLSNASSALVLAQMTTAGTGSCGRPNPSSPCFTASQFATSQMTWGGGFNKSRNNFRGPGYFDSDLNLAKQIHVTEHGLIFSIGAEAINFFNHPNFDRPWGSLSSGHFGKITETVGQPNSPYGNFQGSAANGRIVEAVLKVKF